MKWNVETRRCGKHYGLRRQVETGNFLCYGCGKFLPRSSFSDLRPRAPKPDCKDCTAKEEREFEQKARICCVAAYGGKCKDCGIKDQDVLQLDHIDGTTQPERRKIKGHSRARECTYLFTHEFPAIVDLVCANCHVKRSRSRNQYAGMYLTT